MAGGAVTVTVTVPVTVVCFIEVAVIVAVPDAPLALNVTEVVEELPSVVQAAPEQVHVTPMPASPVAVTLIVTLCPWSITMAVPPGNASLTPEPLPHPPIVIATTKTKHTHTDGVKRFMSFSSRGGPRNPDR
jgi:hypothetical protein